MSYNFKDSQFTWFNQDLQLPSKVFGIFYTTAQATYTAITAPNTQTQTITLRGLRPVTGTGTPPAVEPGDMVYVMPAQTTPLAAGVGVFAAWVSAVNTLSVTLGAVITNTPGTITFTVFVVKMGQNDGINS